jgi:hypothetical protein
MHQWAMVWHFVVGVRVVVAVRPCGQEEVAYCAWLKILEVVRNRVADPEAAAENPEQRRGRERVGHRAGVLLMRSGRVADYW